MNRQDVRELESLAKKGNTVAEVLLSDSCSAPLDTISLNELVSQADLFKKFFYAPKTRSVMLVGLRPDEEPYPHPYREGSVQMYYRWEYADYFRINDRKQGLIEHPELNAAVSVPGNTASQIAAVLIDKHAEWVYLAVYRATQRTTYVKEITSDEASDLKDLDYEEILDELFPPKEIKKLKQQMRCR